MVQKLVAMRVCQIFLISLLILSACSRPTDDSYPNGNPNPPAPGFDQANSDPAAVELADSIMAAMGGRKSWDKTRYISWTFFGRRNLIWDKMTGNVRIDSPGDSTVYLVNVNEDTGRVQVKGREITHADSLAELVSRAKSIWINDSYWLVMPFKLKDTGVTLKYLGEERTDSTRYNLLQLTFANVGRTPENMYILYVDLKDNLVKQWAYYKDASQDSANFVRPWDNYARYGDILLSADRSDKSGPGSVKVTDQMPDGWFDKF